VSRPPENVHADRNAVATELSTVTRGLVVLDNVRYHVDDMGRLKHEWLVYNYENCLFHLIDLF